MLSELPLLDIFDLKIWNRNLTRPCFIILVQAYIALLDIFELKSESISPFKRGGLKRTMGRNGQCRPERGDKTLFHLLLVVRQAFSHWIKWKRDQTCRHVSPFCSVRTIFDMDKMEKFPVRTWVVNKFLNSPKMSRNKRATGVISSSSRRVLTRQKRRHSFPSYSMRTKLDVNNIGLKLTLFQ